MGRASLRIQILPVCGSAKLPRVLTLPSKQDTSVQPRGFRRDLDSSVRKLGWFVLEGGEEVFIT